jgi:uncharacterized protein
MFVSGIGMPSIHRKFKDVPARMLIASLMSGRRDTRFTGMPIFPLGTVLMPGTLLPLRLFEPRYLDMASHAFKTGEPFGICLIREGQEVGTPATPELVGCGATIADWDMEQPGVLKIRALGGERFRLTATRVGRNGLLQGDGEWLPHPRAALDASYEKAGSFLRQVIAQAEDAFAPPHDYADSGWVSMRLTEILPIRMEAKQKLLELDDGNQRMEVLMRFLVAQKLV